MNIINEIKIFFIILVLVLLLDGIMLFFLHSKWNDTITNIQGESLSIRNKVFPVIAYILIVLGILGTYLGRVFNEVKNRPLYVISDEI
jgi:uncharacterized protein YjeT (DUF2065 family)